jgi:hypothetical protein
MINKMPTKFAVVYSKNTGRIRREIFPDSDYELDNIILFSGEDIFILDNSEKAILDDLQVKINKKTGLTPLNDRYAIVDKKNNVVGAIIADPLCGDQIPNHRLVPHEKAGPGWKLDTVKGFIHPDNQKI